MTGKTHCICAGAAALAVTVLHDDPVTTSIAIVTAACIGGLLPDIDHKNSKISKEFKAVSLVARTMSSHRGLFHTPILWIALGALGYFMLPQYFMMWIAPALFGVASHLFLDMLNPTGVPLLWPVSSKKWHIATIKTGSKVEKILASACTAAIVIGLIIAEEAKM
jgi:inner membrane protein